MKQNTKNEKINTKWNLTKFYNNLNDLNLKKDIDSIMPLVLKFKNKYKTKISTFKPKNFITFFNEQEKITKKLNKISFYLNYNFALNTQNQEIIIKKAEFENLITNVSNELLFISQEIKKIGYKNLIKLSKNKELKEYSNFFYQTAKSIKYILNEKNEFILNIKENSGITAFNNLYDEFVNSFLFKIKINNKQKTLTESEIRTLRQSSDEKIRKDALKSIRKIYNDKKTQIVLGNTYNAIVKDHINEIKIRKYKHVLSQRNISEELDDEVVNMLLNEIKNSYYLYQKFLKIKTKLLNKKKLNNYDIYAPINSKEKKINFNEAINLYFKSIKTFDNIFYKYSKDMFKEARVDVFAKKGKMNGAFASFTKGFESYILLNFNNKIDDVFTLAHEMGHAIHGHLRQHLKSENFSAPLILEETSSIFNEMLLFDELKKNLTNKEKLILIEKKLSSIFATIFLQIQYVLFEKEIHEKILNDNQLTFIDFNKIWRNKQIEMYGNTIKFDLPKNQETGWSMIPHIFKSPFYCYSYAFGNLLSFALFKKYKIQGKKFIPKYINILKSGGSKKPYDLLIENNINIKSKKFYQDGIKIIKEILNEFEELSKKIK
ncbi:MAG: M3 family metallopeptidase [Candidatus Woesearchaeota archaeon]